MAGIDNLKTPSAEEARERGTKGGKASGEARKRKKLLREALTELLERDFDQHGEVMSGAEVLAVQVFKKALKGDMRAFELIRDTAGQKPIDQYHVEHERKNDELAELIKAIKSGGAEAVNEGKPSK